MSWDDIEDIIFDGTEEQIGAVSCPECNGDLKLSYFPLTKNIEIRCLDCKTVVRENGVCEEPKFASLGIKKAV
ncbi:MAG: hypothetical protein FWF08_07350 [Oscillospiraceae bacterium]|nr:hypothetical protein [Oscillospiraceae bacterium]